MRAFSPHMTSENKVWKKQKSGTKKQEEECKGNRFPGNSVQGSRCVIKSRVKWSSLITNIIILICGKRGVTNASSCHIQSFWVPCLLLWFSTKSDMKPSARVRFTDTTKQKGTYSSLSCHKAQGKVLLHYEETITYLTTTN